MSGIRLLFYLCLLLALAAEVLALALLFPSWDSGLPLADLPGLVHSGWPPPFFRMHWLAVILFGIAYLLVRVGRRLPVSYTLFFFFVGAASLLPAAGPAVAFLLLAIIGSPARGRAEASRYLVGNRARSEWNDRPAPEPIMEPLVCLMRRKGQAGQERERLTQMILGLRAVVPDRAERFLRQLRQDRDAHVQLLAQGVSAGLTEAWEKRVRSFRRRVGEAADDGRSRLALAEALLVGARSRQVTLPERRALTSEALDHLRAAETCRLSSGERARALGLTIETLVELGDAEQAERYLAILKKLHPAVKPTIMRFERLLLHARRDWGGLARHFVEHPGTFRQASPPGAARFWRGQPLRLRRLREGIAA